MRALVIAKHGPPDVLRVQDRPAPVPGAGEVLVRVRAAGINFADLMARIGVYPDAPKPPSVIGYEVAGEVESVGEGVEGIAPGDRVMAGTRFGGYAELVSAKANAVIPLPDGWSFEEGAAFPVNYATAYAGLVRYGALAAGERVLLHAAAGGVASPPPRSPSSSARRSTALRRAPSTRPSAASAWTTRSTTGRPTSSPRHAGSRVRRSRSTS